MTANPVPLSRIRVSKGAVNCQQRRKAVITGYRFGTHQLIEFRTFADNRDQGAFVDLSVPQARELVRLLQTAIASHEGPALSSTGREPVGVDSSHAGQKA